jgi:hypothetical protein
MPTVIYYPIPLYYRGKTMNKSSYGYKTNAVRNK